MKKLSVSVALALTTLALAACSPGSSTQTSATPSTPASTPTSNAASTPDAAAAETDAAVIPAGETPITLTADGQTITATLNDSQVSQDFAAMLPVELDWYRNIGIEYITELDAPLTEDGPFYTDVQPGDIVYYNPMDSLTIIYDETSSVPTLTLMGEITSDLSVFDALPDDVTFVVERAE
ncbi:hypothetical protein HQQ80_17365 [Microbacteriaceae bacterium VKM Ac-2855]|nr:hypothetical protein [Microbacteriaceae bacterium VKM Ac-2855]